MWSVKALKDSIFIVEFKDISAGWEQYVLLRSDTHHDSLYCNREVEKKHLDMALERNAPIIDGGDLLDAMQGKFDPRRNYDDVRPEYLGADYYDRIVKDAVKFYAPYANNLIILGRGNHEYGVLRNANTDVTSNLAYGLNLEHVTDGHVYPAGYGAWVRFSFTMRKTVKQKIDMRNFHGKSVSAPVTKGAIQNMRQAVYLRDMDVVWNGHNHEGYIMYQRTIGLNRQCNIEKKIMWFVRTPGYKDGWGDGIKGFDVEKTSPKTLGAAWLHFQYDGRKVKVTPIPEIE